MGKTKFRFNKKLLFYIFLLTLPMLQFSVFYIYVNFNSLLLALKMYEQKSLTSTFVGFENFKNVFSQIFSQEKVDFSYRFKNSMLFYFMTLAVGMLGAIFFSYYIYKKQLFHGFFKIILFLPHIIPGVALISMYKNYAEEGVREIINQLFNLKIESMYHFPGPGLATLMFFALFIGFGTQVLMYLGAMNKINPSITEAADLDGITFFRELWSITVPNIFSTISTFIVVGLTSVFTADMGAFTMFSTTAPIQLQTLGYYLQRLTYQSASNYSHWGFISAMGLCFTFIVAPLTYLIRQGLEKIDPVA